IEAKYEGYIKGSNNDNKTKYQGELEIPNLSDENSIDEVNVSFSIEKEKAQKFKELMITHGTPIIRHRLGEYVRLLKEEFSQGLILPTKDKIVSSSVERKPPPSSTTTAPKTSLSTSNTTSSSSSKPLQTKDLVIEDHYKCSRNELFQVFTDSNMVKAFTQNSVQQYDCKQGGSFSLFGGNITGNFLDIIPYDTIEMLWRFKQWPDEHFSHVRLEFVDENDQTKLIVRQNGVPEQFYDNTMEGWRRFYIQAIKQTFGYGARLLIIMTKLRKNMSELNLTFRTKTYRDLAHKLRFDDAESARLAAFYEALSDPNTGLIPRERFRDFLSTVFNISDEILEDRIFSLLDDDRDMCINLKEWLNAMGIFLKATFDEQLKFVFRVYDVSGDGNLQREEIYSFLRKDMPIISEKLHDSAVRSMFIILGLPETSKKHMFIRMLNGSTTLGYTIPPPKMNEMKFSEISLPPSP
ncbi:unnamed protein product, partial [Didymodactylos carnosus]